MCLTIANSQISELELSHPERLDTRYTENGVLKILTGGSRGWYTRLIEWGEKTDVKQCPNCKGFHDRNNPPLCFACATGQN